MRKLLRVSKVTASSNGGFVVTLKEDNKNVQSVIVDTPFGKATKSDGRETLNTYYMKLNDSPPINLEAEIDLDDYNIVERPFTTDSDKDIDMKWLHLK